MNREIKLRAWDEGNEIMHYDFQFIKSGNTGSDWIVFSSDKQKLSDEKHPLDNPYFAQQLKFMQYIGRDDINNKPVYEGDIIKTDSGKLQVVSYRDDMTRFVIRQNKGASMDIPHILEVVGNIYETPHLIE